MNLTELSSSELSAVEGGGFAYDLGRGIRFVVIGYFQGGVAATADWYITSWQNEQA